MKNLLLTVALLALLFSYAISKKESKELVKQLNEVNNWDLQYLDAVDSLIYYGNKIIEGDTLGQEECVKGFRRNAEVVKRLYESE